LLNPNIRIFADKRPTICVTCAGVGTAKPFSQKNDKAQKKAWDVREIPGVWCKRGLGGL